MKARAYLDSFGHITDELRALELLLEIRIFERRLFEAMLHERAPVSDAARRALNARRRPHLRAFRSPRLEQLRGRYLRLRTALDDRIRSTLAAGTYLALPHLGALFQLNQFETSALLICAAPELDPGFETLYGALSQTDGRRRPSVDIILETLCETDAERLRARRLLADGSVLLRESLIETGEGSAIFATPSSDRALIVAARILNFLLLDNAVDRSLQAFVSLHAAPRIAAPPDRWPLRIETARRLNDLLSARVARAAGPCCIQLYGPAGSITRELLLELSASLRMNLLELDASVLAHQPGAGAVVVRIAQEALLQSAVIHVKHASVLSEHSSLLTVIARETERHALTLVYSGAEALPLHGRFDRSSIHNIAVPLADYAVRRRIWERELESLEGAGAAWANELAGRYELTPGQIHDASLALQDTLSPTVKDAFRAARAQARHNLGRLAFQVPAGPGWDDLIASDEVLEHLREISAQLRYRFRVLDEWGYGEKLPYGRGLSVLFAGPPGTGKTLAAQIIAGELELDLYKVDLSRVVSKYIGETEQNLSRVFDEARYSNALLFFDEADALFGKRTAIGDARDRYANIETGYLLQKMEDYDGAVILASNYRDNVDEAFLRRIRFIVEFPFPDQAARCDIWRSHFPEKTPTHALDHEILARRFHISGGSIKNVALNAAFLAARDGRNVVEMEHVLHCARRELEKIGQLWVPPDEAHSRSNDRQRNGVPQ